MPCPEVVNPLTERMGLVPPEPGVDPPIVWTGFSVFSDVHASTPPTDSQQAAPLQLACFVMCDEPVCGGLGGFLVWWSNSPEHLEQGCDHPDNPIPGMLS